MELTEKRTGKIPKKLYFDKKEFTDYLTILKPAIPRSILLMLSDLSDKDKERLLEKVIKLDEAGYKRERKILQTGKGLYFRGIKVERIK